MRSYLSSRCDLPTLLCLPTLFCALTIGAALTVASPTRLHAQCSLSDVRFAWSQPKNLDILDENSARWSIDGSVRVAFGGDWCPSEEQLSFTDLDGAPIPALVMIRTPANLVENLSPPISLLTVKPLMSLDPRHDYELILSPENPALSLDEDYTLAFRTQREGSGDFPDFEGVTSVELDGDTCMESGPIQPGVESFDCPVGTYIRLRVFFQPVDDEEITYLVQRVSSVPMGEGGEVDVEGADESTYDLAYLAGLSGEFAAQPLSAVINVTYGPLPRRDCFRVMALDSWGRERGDPEQISCIDLRVPDPCPPGCDPMMQGSCQIVFPMPNPFADSTPVPGSSCDNLGLNGASAATQIPPLNGGEGGAGGEGGGAGAGGEGGPSGEADQGPGADQGGGESSSSDEGCAQGLPHHSRLPALALLLALCLLRRREGRLTA